MNAAAPAVETLASEVRRLFARLDRRELDAFAASFAPGAEIVHDDGQAGTPSELVSELRAGRPAVRRKLGPFKGGVSGRFAWVAYENEVVFADGARETLLRFSETALLESAEGGWRFVRIHYSGRRP